MKLSYLGWVLLINPIIRMDKIAIIFIPSPSFICVFVTTFIGARCALNFNNFVNILIFLFLYRCNNIISQSDIHYVCFFYFTSEVATILRRHANSEYLLSTFSYGFITFFLSLPLFPLGNTCCRSAFLPFVHCVHPCWNFCLIEYKSHKNFFM